MPEVSYRNIKKLCEKLIIQNEVIDVFIENFISYRVYYAIFQVFLIFMSYVHVYTESQLIK